MACVMAILIPAHARAPPEMAKKAFWLAGLPYRRRRLAVGSCVGDGAEGSLPPIRPMPSLGVLLIPIMPPSSLFFLVLFDIGSFVGGATGGKETGAMVGAMIGGSLTGANVVGSGVGAITGAAVTGAGVGATTGAIVTGAMVIGAPGIEELHPHGVEAAIPGIKGQLSRGIMPS